MCCSKKVPPTATGRKLGTAPDGRQEPYILYWPFIMTTFVHPLIVIVIFDAA